MRKFKLVFFALSCFIALTAFSGLCFAQAPAIQWQKCYGGVSTDIDIRQIEQTSDGGYIAIGSTFSNDGDVSVNHGGCDIWVIKIDAIGTIQWQKCYGGTSTEFGFGIQKTTDGGYIMCGYTYSNDGDVSGNHGNADAWVVKIDAIGTIQWQKCYGGTSSDVAYRIILTTDGGYAVCGATSSINGDVSGNHGGNDAWVIKTDAIGTIQWQKCYGGTSSDFCYSIKEISEGGYVLLNVSASNDGDVSGNHGNFDSWLTKIDAAGTIQWQKCYGGTGEDAGYQIISTTDGGYIFTAGTDSNDGDVSGNHGNADYWIVKIDATGTIQWQKCYGGSSYDYGIDIKETSPGNYIIVGGSDSNDGDVSGNHGGGYDLWCIGLNNLGNLQWQKCYGGTSSDVAYCVISTPTGLVAAGVTQSNDADVSGNHGGSDCWIVKLTSTVLPIVLKSFDAQVIRDNTVRVGWVTTSEINNDYFEVQASTDGVTWKSIGRVNSCHGNCSGDIAYNLTDYHPFVGGVSYYRLKQFDVDGKFVYSHVATVKILQSKISIIFRSPGIYTVLGLVPKTNIQIYTMTGSLLKSERSANSSFEINITNYPKGSYVLRINENEEKVFSQILIN